MPRLMPSKPDTDRRRILKRIGILPTYQKKPTNRGRRPKTEKEKLAEIARAEEEEKRRYESKYPQIWNFLKRKPKVKSYLFFSTFLLFN